MKIIQKDVHVFYENETYHRREKIFGTVSNIRWFFGTSYIRLELEEKLEAEYQKTLIPTKTLNLSEEKGSITNLVKQFCKEKQYYDDGKDVLEQFAKWIKANGEKPEVVNPVGQVDMKKLEKDIIKDLKSLDLEYLQNSDDEAAIADTIIQTIKKHINKPRETDKEEPLYTEEDMKQFGLFLGMNYDKFSNVLIEDIFKVFKGL